MLPDDCGECSECGRPLYGSVGGGRCEACSISHTKCAHCGELLWYGESVALDDFNGYLCEMCQEPETFEFTPELEMLVHNEKEDC